VVLRYEMNGSCETADFHGTKGIQATLIIRVEIGFRIRETAFPREATNSGHQHLSETGLT